MKVCNKCNTPMNDNEQFCIRCGGNQFRQVQQPINRPNMSNQQMQQVNQQQTVRQMPNRPGQQIRPNINNQQMQQQQMTQQMQQQQMQQVMSNNGIQSMQQQQMVQPGNQVIQQNNYTPQQAAETKLSRKEKREAKKAQEKEIMEQIRTGQVPSQSQPQQTYTNQQAYPQNTYEQTNNPYTESYETGMTVKDWIIQIILTVIPLVNIVVLIKGMNNYTYPEYRRNFCKAFLIYYITATVLSIGLSFVLSYIGIV